MLSDEERRTLELMRKEQTDAEAEALRQAEMSGLEELRRKLLSGEITDEELRRLRELEAKYGMDELKDPFADQKLMNQEFDENMNLSKISD